MDVMDVDKEAITDMMEVAGGLAIVTTIMYARQYFLKEPYHTSALTGEAWVLELLAGHRDRIRCELGVRHHVFHKLVETLQDLGYKRL